MELRAFLNDDGTSVVSFGTPGQMAGFEVPWHKAVLMLTTEDGGLSRSITVTPGVAAEVDGPTPAEHVGQGETGEVKP